MDTLIFQAPFLHVLQGQARHTHVAFLTGPHKRGHSIIYPCCLPLRPAQQKGQSVRTHPPSGLCRQIPLIMISGADVWVPHCQHLHHAWLLVLGSNARGLSSLSRLSSSGTVGMQEAGHVPLVACFAASLQYSTTSQHMLAYRS